MRDKISRLIRLDRQSFLGEGSAETLNECFAATVGLGGGGSHVNQQLTHLGVGNLAIFDPDKVEETNLNRLVGATEEDVAQEPFEGVCRCTLDPSGEPVGPCNQFQGQVAAPHRRTKILRHYFWLR